jgi:hypothetical protein
MITSKIVAWLEEHGYPLEMYVASVFQNLGFKVDQGIYFSDPETGSSREVDIVAHKNFSINGKYVSFVCIIECKSSKEKPWLCLRVYLLEILSRQCYIFR